jgi:hypothetical protein
LSICQRRHVRYEFVDSRGTDVEETSKYSTTNRYGEWLILQRDDVIVRMDAISSTKSNSTDTRR